MEGGGVSHLRFIPARATVLFVRVLGWPCARKRDRCASDLGFTIIVVVVVVVVNHLEFR